MSIEASHVLFHVIKPILHELGAFEPRLKSESAERLLMLTAAHESQMGRWIVQRNYGPARGIFQMEKPAFTDAQRAFRRLCPGVQIADSHDKLATDLGFAAVMARMYYWLAPEALPDPMDDQGLAEYWHTYWCKGCAGTVEKALSNYRALVLSRIAHWGDRPQPMKLRGIETV